MPLRVCSPRENIRKGNMARTSPESQVTVKIRQHQLKFFWQIVMVQSLIIVKFHVVGCAVKFIHLFHLLLDIADSLHRASDIAVSHELHIRAGSDEADHGFGVKFGQHTWNPVEERMPFDVACADKILHPGQTGHADGGLHPLVQGRQPVGSGAAHAHAGDTNALWVDLRAGGEIV